MAKEGFVDIEIRNVPEKLLKKFDKTVVKPYFPGGRSEAIRTLMREEIRRRLKEAFDVEK